MAALPRSVLEAALNQVDRSHDDALVADITGQTAQLQQQQAMQPATPQWSLPSLDSLLGNSTGGQEQPQQQVGPLPAPMPTAQAPTWGAQPEQRTQGWTLPSLNSLLGLPDEQPKPARQQPGIDMGSVTLQDGRQQAGPSMAPGEQVGGVSMATGPAPERAGEYRAYARAVAQQYGLDPDIFERQINQESGFRPWGPDGKPLGSSAGAQGIAQFMPGTAASYGVDVNDPYSSLDGAARHMRDLLQRNNGDYRMALAAYNAGQGNVDRYGEGVFGDDFAHGETKRYVTNILGGRQPQQMQRTPLNAGASPPPATPAPAGVSSAPAGAPPAAPWEGQQPWQASGGDMQRMALAEDAVPPPWSGDTMDDRNRPPRGVYTDPEGVDATNTTIRYPGTPNGQQPMPGRAVPLAPLPDDAMYRAPLGEQAMFGPGDGGFASTSPQLPQNDPQLPQNSPSDMRDVDAGPRELIPAYDPRMADTPSARQDGAAPTLRDHLGNMLVPIIDAGGRVVSYLQQAAGAALDRMMEGPRPPQSEADRRLQESARTITQPVDAAFGGVARSVEQSMGLPEGAAMQAAQDVSGVLGPEQAISAARTVARAARAVPSEVRAIGSEVDDALRPITGAVETRGVQGATDDAIRQIEAIDQIVLPPSTRALPEPVQQAVQTIEEYRAQIGRQYEQAADFSAALRNPDPVPAPSIARPDADQLIREQYGRPWEEVAGVGPGRSATLGEATAQVMDEGQGVGGPRNRVYPSERESIGGPVQIEPQSINLNATPGMVPSAGLVADLGNAVGGGVAGAAVGAGLPAETPEERRRNALLMAGAGMLGAPVLGRALPNSGGALATFGTSPNYRPPSAAQVQAAQAQAARRGQQLNRAVSAPPSEVPARVRAATVATDDRAAMRWAEDMLSDAAGSPRMRENDPARPSTMSRVNAGAVANERIANGLEPPVVNAGRAGLQDELPQYLEDMHQRDILDEFYRRGHQDVMDERAQAIATAQARGASPSTIQRMQAKAQTDAHAAGLRKMRQRQGSNPEMTYEAIDARLQAQEQRVTAAGKKQELDDAAQAIWDHNAETRQRLVDAGEMDPADAAHYAQAYPHYVPTVPISHLDARGGQAVSASSGTRVSRGNQGVVKALEDVGTSGERLNPIVASRNATVRAERAIQRNNVARAFAQMMDDALQASPSTMGTNAATHRTFLGGGVDVTFFDNGKPVTISVPKPVADGLEAAANMGMSSNGLAAIWKRVMGAVTSTMTAARASFLPVNLLRDVQDFATRTMAREGGPQNLPSILATWADEAGRAAADIAMAQVNPRGLAGAASGAVTGAAVGDENTTPAERVRNALALGVVGTFLVGANRVKPTGAAREFMARGGGSGAASADWRVGQRWYRDVMRDGGVPIKTPADAARFFADWGADILSLQGVKGINERTELISRTAAMRRAEKGGSGPVEAMVAGRDATVDFDRAGTWARMVNGIVPFFNATVQGGAQTARAIKQNPVAFSASIAATLGPVMLGAEAWNRSDPVRAAVYDDVPQYVKDTGLVVVTPWAGSDNRGERPNYVWIPTGMTTPFVIGMRAAMEGLPGLEPVAGRVGTKADASTPEKWADVFEQVAQVFSPIRGDSAASVASNFVPPIAKQVVELGQNKDMFRGNPIASDSADERASTFGRRVAEGVNEAGRMVGSDFLQEVRPSQVDYLARQLPAYGDIITGASDMVAPTGYKQAEDRPIQNAPGAGGMAARFVRDTGGANMQRAQDEALSEPVREVFEAAGMRPSELTPVPSRWKNGTLTREEQLRWQEAFNAEIGRAMTGVRRDPKWRDPTTREQAVKDALSQARERAAERARLPGADVMERRIRNEQRMKAS